MRNRILGSLVLLIAAVIGAAGQEQFVRPVDEAGQDPTFAAFRTKLIAAAERRDKAYILGILDPQIKLSFGGDEGVADFKRMWKFSSRNTPFWKEFLAVIKNGGTFMKENGRKTGEFWAPYTYGRFPEALDPFEVGAIFGTDVNLRSAPSTTAPVVARLSYNVVEIQPETVPKSGRSEYPDWWEVKTLGGLRGYVRKEYVRGALDLRAAFEKKRGKWRLTVFIAGD